MGAPPPGPDRGGEPWSRGFPPPRPTYGGHHFAPSVRPWRRGGYLPPADEARGVDDYWRFHLRRPPYGYRWVEVGNQYLLVSTSTGLIFDVVPGR
ncbi:MAG TPA: RcnB family protein [Caulobacteraceae bacterium]|nr:RcnB family protein [Caulobacteraceae bacterium]